MGGEWASETCLFYIFFWNQSICIFEARFPFSRALLYDLPNLVGSLIKNIKGPTCFGGLLSLRQCFSVARASETCWFFGRKYKGASGFRRLALPSSGLNCRVISALPGHEVLCQYLQTLGEVMLMFDGQFSRDQTNGILVSSYWSAPLFNWRSKILFTSLENGNLQHLDQQHGIISSHLATTGAISIGSLFSGAIALAVLWAQALLKSQYTEVLMKGEWASETCWFCSIFWSFNKIYFCLTSALVAAGSTA